MEMGKKSDRKKRKLRSNRMEIFSDQKITDSSGRKNEWLLPELLRDC